MRWIVTLAVVLVLLCVPLVGNAETLATIKVYNSGFVVPDLYCYLFMNVVGEDMDGGLGISSVMVCDVALIRLSGFYGTRDLSLQINSASDLEDFSRLSNLSGGWAVPIISAIPLDVAYSDLTLEELVNRYNYDTDVRLISGYTFGQNVSFPVLEGEFTDAALMVTCLKIFQDGISVGESSATNSDVATIDGALTMPTPPPAQNNYLDRDSVARAGFIVGKVLPQQLLLPLFTFLGFSFAMVLLSLMKHA